MEVEGIRTTTTITEWFVEEYDRELALHLGVLRAKAKAVLVHRTLKALTLGFSEHRRWSHGVLELDEDDGPFTWRS
jgi:hypothetical protein